MQWRGLNSAAGLASAQLRCSDNHRPVMNDNCVLFTSVYGNLFTDLDYKFWKLNMSNDFLPILKGSALFQPWLCLNFGHCGINWFCPVELTSAFKKHLWRHVFYPLPQVLVLLKKKKKVEKGKGRPLGETITNDCLFLLGLSETSNSKIHNWDPCQGEGGPKGLICASLRPKQLVMKFSSNRIKKYSSGWIATKSKGAEWHTH